MGFIILVTPQILKGKTMRLWLLVLFLALPSIIFGRNTFASTSDESHLENSFTEAKINKLVLDLIRMKACQSVIDVRIMNSKLDYNSRFYISYHETDDSINNQIGTKIAYTSDSYITWPVCGWYFLPKSTEIAEREQRAAIHDATPEIDEAAKQVVYLLDLSSDDGGVIAPSDKGEKNNFLELVSKAEAAYERSIAIHLHKIEDSGASLNDIQLPQSQPPEFYTKDDPNFFVFMMMDRSRDAINLRNTTMKDMAAFEQFFIREPALDGDKAARKTSALTPAAPHYVKTTEPLILGDGVRMPAGTYVQVRYDAGDGWITYSESIYPKIKKSSAVLLESKIFDPPIDGTATQLTAIYELAADSDLSRPGIPT